MGQLLAFCAISLLVIITPGQDTALTIRNILVGGRRAGMATAVGIVAGQSVWSLATSAGLSAAVVAVQPLFLALRIAGSAYLIFLGLSALRSATRRHAADEPTAPRRGQISAATALRQGLISNVSNPKMIVFFTSLLPQFATTFTGLALHGLLFSALTLAWLTLYTLAVAKARHVLSRQR
ncbi:MAG: LysE family translocator, partial [Candidatus Dormibacteraeota bacterium]|nr:LysE family translocator [Candidatus Dormibacteraeota bacterium]